MLKCDLKGRSQPHFVQYKHRKTSARKSHPWHRWNDLAGFPTPQLVADTTFPTTPQMSSLHSSNTSWCWWFQIRLHFKGKNGRELKNCRFCFLFTFPSCISRCIKQAFCIVLCITVYSAVEWLNWTLSILGSKNQIAGSNLEILFMCQSQQIPLHHVCWFLSNPAILQEVHQCHENHGQLQHVSAQETEPWHSSQKAGGCHWIAAHHLAQHQGMVLLRNPVVVVPWSLDQIVMNGISGASEEEATDFVRDTKPRVCQLRISEWSMQNGSKMLPAICWPYDKLHAPQHGHKHIVPWISPWHGLL